MSLLFFLKKTQNLGHPPCSLVLPFRLSRLQFPACCSPWFIVQQIVPADRAYGAPAELRRNPVDTYITILFQTKLVVHCVLSKVIPIFPERTYKVLQYY